MTALRRREQEAMAAFGADGRCLMRALQEELDDPDPQDCGRCAVCAGPRYDAPLDPELVRAAALLLRSRPIVLETKKMAPDDGGAMRKIPEDVRAEEGRALARLGDGGWDPVVQAGRREGRFDGDLVAAAAETVKTWQVPVAWVAAVPSRRSGELVPDFARQLAEALGLPFAAAIERVGDSPPQRGWTTRPSRSPTCAASSRWRATSRPARACWSTTSLQRLDAGDDRRRAAPPGAPAVYPLALTSAF